MPKRIASSSDSASAPLSIGVIGAGMSGLLMAARLKMERMESFTVYEKADRPGGTWRDNVYPGLYIDAPSYTYVYPFALNPNWSHFLAPGKEIFEYLSSIVGRFRFGQNIRFSCEVTSARYEAGKWRVTTSQGDEYIHDILISATGFLHHPSYPDIPGLASFGGPMFHSSRWDHTVQLDGTRIGIIGIGSTGAQLVVELALRAGKLVSFQRTPQWVLKRDNFKYSWWSRLKLKLIPGALARQCDAERERTLKFFGGYGVDPDTMKMIADLCRENLESVKDPQLRERLTPTYEAGCKRLVMSPNYYERLQLPSVEVETGTIDHVEPGGVVMADGRFHALDVLVLATGFKAENGMRPMALIGQGGVSIDEVWADGPQAHRTIAIPGFPNFFMLLGPSSPVASGSLVTAAHYQVDYILKLVAEMRRRDVHEVEVKAEAAERFNQGAVEASGSTVWTSGCASWYINKSGRLLVWPWRYDKFLDDMSQLNLDEYHLRIRDEVA